MKSIENESLYDNRIPARHKNYETIKSCHGASVIQYPFSGEYRPLKVVENPTLFRRTKQRQESMTDSCSKTIEPRKTFCGFGSKNFTASQFSDLKTPSQDPKCMDSSFGSNFPFFSKVDTKDEE